MNYQLSEKTVSRIVNDELIIIQLDTGRHHYFSKDTEGFLQHFKCGTSVDDFVTLYSLGLNEKRHVQKLCDSLLERNILKSSTNTSDVKSRDKLPYRRPVFLRDGEKTLDQISFASP